MADDLKIFPRSIKLGENLNSQVNDFLLVREETFSELMGKALFEYLQKHPLTKEEIKVLESFKKLKAKKKS